MSSNTEFHRLDFNGNPFIAHVYGGDLYLTRTNRGGSYLGPSIITRTRQRRNPDYQGPWHICKYDPFQPQISLADLTNEQIIKLSAEFGIEIQGELRDFRPPHFFETNAWEGLKQYVQDRPRFAKKEASQKANYEFYGMGGWYERAIAASPPQEPKKRLTKGRVGDAKVEMANDFVAEQIELNNCWGKEGREMARRALEISPLCVDAYLILAACASSGEREISHVQKAVAAGEKYLGSAYFADADRPGRFWGDHDSRPYMRANAMLATLYIIHGRRGEAIDVMQRMIKLNPNDNQGIRYMLAPALAAEGRDDEMEKLLKQTDWDKGPIMSWNRALLAIRVGDPEATALLADAMNENVFVADYLLGRKASPHHRDAVEYSAGSAEEAHNYAITAAE
jgi:tetratricopeptide (TPR) repeat protein